VTPEQTKRAALLLEALAEIPNIEKQLKSKNPPKYGDGYSLEISANEMKNGIGQGSNAYLYLEPRMGLKLLPVIKQMLTDELKALGVKL